MGRVPAVVPGGGSRPRTAPRVALLERPGQEAQLSSKALPHERRLPVQAVVQRPKLNGHTQSSAVLQIVEICSAAVAVLRPRIPDARSPPLSGHRLGMDQPSLWPLREAQRRLKVWKPDRVARTTAASVDELKPPTLCRLSLDLALHQRPGAGQGCYASVDVPRFQARQHPISRRHLSLRVTLCVPAPSLSDNLS
jgi:hypothetical protein